MAILKQSTTYTRVFLLVSSSDHITGLTLATVTVSISKAGGTFATAGGTVTEIANGFYKVALTTTDTNTVGDLAFNCTATGADPSSWVDQVSPTIINDITTDGSGNVSTTSTIKKNVARNAFPFVMTDSSTHLPKTTLTVTATRSIDGAAFSATANSPTEIANGLYVINLANSDLNGNCIDLRLTATGADDLNIPILTQP